MLSKQNFSSCTSGSRAYDRIIELVKEQELAKQNLIEVEDMIQDIKNTIRKSESNLL